MMWQYGSGMAGWGPVLLTISNVVIWSVVVVGVLALARHLGRSRSTPRATAEELLAERFARGEIDEQEYRARLDVLRRSPVRAPD